MFKKKYCMRKIVVLLVFSLFFINVKAHVSYGDLAFGDYNMKINISTEKDSIYLVVTYTDSKNKLTDTPRMLIRLMDNSVISLEGKMMGVQSKSDGGVVISGVYVASNHFVSEARFPISIDEMQSFKHGLKKLRLNTSPKYHEKEWKRDKIGKKLYENYIKSSSNSFEDNF